MATVHYYSDTSGGAVRLSSVWPVSRKELGETLPGSVGVRLDGTSQVWVGQVAAGEDVSGAVLVEKGIFQGRYMMVATRKVTFKSNPSLHVCNAKCMGATRHACECSCRGRNHGHS